MENPVLNGDLTNGPRSSLLQITPAERAVLQLMADGRTAYEIAERLAIAHADVDAYLSALVVRMRVATRADAVAAASRRGLVALHEDDAIARGSKNVHCRRVRTS